MYSLPSSPPTIRPPRRKGPALGFAVDAAQVFADDAKEKQLNAGQKGHDHSEAVKPAGTGPTTMRT